MSTPSNSASSQRRVYPIVMINGIESLHHQGRDFDAYRSSAAATVEDPPPASHSQVAADDCVSISASEAPSHLSRSWVCPQCSYKNADPQNDKCALCGVSDRQHVVDYEQIKHQRRARSYSWLSLASSPEEMTSHFEGESIVPMSPLTTPAMDQTPKLSQPPMTTQTPVAIDPHRPTASNDNTVSRLKNETPTLDKASCRAIKKTEGEKLLPVIDPISDGLDKKRNDTFNSHIWLGHHLPKAKLSSHLQPRRHDSFDEEFPSVSPNKRPPKSPASKRQIVRGDEGSRVVVSGFCIGRHDSVNNISPRSETSSMVVLPGEHLFPDADCTDASVTNHSIASFSTVKASNIQLNIGSDNWNQPPTSPTRKSGTNAAPVSSDAILTQWIKSTADDKNKNNAASPTSMKAPGRSSSSPPGLPKIGASNSHQDRPSALEIRQFNSEINRSSIYPIQEDSEQASSPPLQHSQNHIVSPTSVAYVDTDTALSQPNSYTSVVISSNNDMGRTDASLELLPTSDRHGNNSDCSVDMLEFQGDDSHRQQQQERQRQLKSKLGRQRPACVMWTIVSCIIVFGVAVALSVILLANDSKDSSNQFQVGTFPAVPPSPSPSSADSPTSIPAKDIPPRRATLPPRDDALNAGTESPNARQLQLIAVEMGQVSNRLGSSVATGGPTGETWIAMIGEDFVRVMEVIPTTDESNYSVTTGQTSGAGLLKLVGSDTPIPSEKGIYQLAMASDSRRMATVVGNGLLSVHEFDSKSIPNNTWDTLQSTWIAAEEVLQGDSMFVPTSVSLSADGQYVATASISPTVRGDYLMAHVLQVKSMQPAATYATIVREPGNGTAHEAVFVEISNDGSTLIICTKDDILVKRLEISDENGGLALVSMGGQPVLPLGVTVRTCALSGDGSTLGVTITTSGSTAATIIFAYQVANGWKEIAAILVSGLALSFDYSGDLMALGDSTDGDGIVSVWSRNNDNQSSIAEYKLLDQIFGQNFTSEFGASVALSKRLEQQLLVVGAPSGGKESEGCVHVYQI